MDPVQLMMAAHQADAAVAAQTPDQALQAAIAQTRPDLWAPLSTNPAAYPDLLGRLASTGNVEVLANLRARGYLTDDAAANAADAAGAVGAVGAADTVGGEPAVDPAVAQEGPAQTESVESAEDGDTPVDEVEAADESEPAVGDEVADVAGEVGDEQEAEESAEGPDAAGGEETTESADEAAPESDTEAEVVEDAAGEVQDSGTDEPDDEVEDDVEDAPVDDDPGEVDGEQETEEPAEGAEVDEAEGEPDSDPATEPMVEPTEADEAVGADDDSGEVGDEPVAEEPAEDAAADESSDERSAASADAAEEPESGESAPEGTGSVAAESADEPEEDVVVDESAGDGGAEGTDTAEVDTETGTEAVEGAGDEAGGSSDNNETTVLTPASQWREVDSADTTDFTVAPQFAAAASGWTAGSAAPAAGSAESVALPVPPPPSAEDIAAWAETPSGAPSGFSAAQPAVELDMFGPQMMAQMPPPQRNQPSNSSTGRLIAIIVVLLLIIVGGGGLWAGSYFANKGKGGDSSDASQDKADGNGGEGDTQNGQADAAATSTAAALPSGAVKACSSMPTFTITSVEDGQGELKVQGNMATSCADGDFLAGASNQVLVYSSASPAGGADVDRLVASGTFDLSGDPLIIPNGGRAVTLRFGEQHYFRTAKDLDLKGLSVRPSFDRGSPSSATAKSSTNSPMIIASSTSSNTNQEAQDEQAAGEAIQWQVKHDYPIVKERLLHQWTPQVSSKQVGLKADGVIWNNRSILAEYLRTRQANPNAVIIDTSQWPVYDDKDWWVTLQGDSYPDADQANAWCDAQGYDSDHCLAKRIESSGSPQGTTKSR